MILPNLGIVMWSIKTSEEVESQNARVDGGSEQGTPPPIVRLIQSNWIATRRRAIGVKRLRYSTHAAVNHLDDGVGRRERAAGYWAIWRNTAVRLLRQS